MLGFKKIKRTLRTAIHPLILVVAFSNSRVQASPPVSKNQIKRTINIAELYRGRPIVETPRRKADEKESTSQAMTIIDLQKFRDGSTLEISGAGGSKGLVTLVNLQPKINAWYILGIRWPNSKEISFFHLENPEPSAQTLVLSQEFADGLTIVRGTEKKNCELWGKAGLAIKLAQYSKKPYAPLCEGRLYVRNKVDGNKTTQEWFVEFLRDNVWGGEKITTFVKETIFKDRFVISTEATAGAEPSKTPTTKPPRAGGPKDAFVERDYEGFLIEPKELGVNVDLEADGKLFVGRWYEAKEVPGVFASVIQPKLIAKQILSSHPRVVNPLDNVEVEALSYLVAYDLQKYEVAFSLGTDHPEVNWSERCLEQVIDKSKPGPDGIGTAEPIVPTGIINPEESKRVISTFTGGFKRVHGAFHWGDLAVKNSGSHYGFIENGVIFSKLQPGLATYLSLDNGEVRMKTWTAADEPLLERIRYARQNGVAVIEHNDETGRSFPGPLVSQWGPGNWSGSQDSKFRTLRAGICLHNNEGRPYLIYAYFSGATPSAMARVFQAYDCQYAMHLDMNALEHTYLAMYAKKDKAVHIQHLIAGMEVLDKNFKGQEIPRFVGFPDNRDYFYVLRRR